MGVRQSSSEWNLQQYTMRSLRDIIKDFNVLEQLPVLVMDRLQRVHIPL